MPWDCVRKEVRRGVMLVPDNRLLSLTVLECLLLRDPLAARLLYLCVVNISVVLT